jgi:hypothetical protein
MATGINDLVTISATDAARTLTANGFGRTCVLGYHTVFPENYRIYREPDALISDGFATDDPVYKMAAAVFDQSPRPVDLMVGRLPSAHTHTQVLSITSDTAGQYVRLNVTINGVTTPVERLIPGSSSPAAEATAVELLIEAITGVSSSAASADITITPATPGDVIYLTGLENCTVEDATPDAGYDDQIAVISAQSEGNGGFFFWAIDTHSETNIDLCAAWATTNKRPFMYQVIDYTEKAGTGALFSGLEGGASEYAFGVYTDDPEAYVQCGVAGFAGARSPGTFTVSMKPIIGVTPAILTATEETNLQGNNANFYVTRAGLPMIRGTDGGGVVASGQFLDIVHGRDAFLSDAQIAVATVMANNDKVDYTDEGVDLLLGALNAVGDRYSGKGKLFKAGTFFSRGEPVDDQSATDKGNRYYGAIKFGATYNGAIHKVNMTGVLVI